MSVVAEHMGRRAKLGSYSHFSDEFVRGFAKGNPEVAEIIIAGLAKTWPRDNAPMLKTETQGELVKLFPKLSPAGKGQFLKLASAWRIEGVEKYAAETAQGLMTVATDEKRADPDRIAAAKQ